jgi:hypothetical protein
MKNNKKWLVPVIIIVVLLVAIIVLLAKKSGEQVVVVPPTPTTQISSTITSAQPSPTSETTPTTQSIKPGKPTTTTLPEKAISCATPQCFSPYFLKCTPVELKMPFSDSAFLIITVFGVEDGKCHYASKIVDASGKAIPLGPPSTECFVPVDKITTATVEHFFGANQTEDAKAEQDKIEADYCIKQ